MISDAGMQKLCRTPAKEVHHFWEMPWHTISFACSWARLDTYRLPEHAPQNRLQNGWAVVEVSEHLFSYLLPYAHHLLSHLIWSVLHDLGPVRIPSHPVKMLHKTVYETVKPLRRQVHLYFVFFLLYATHHLLSHLIWSVLHNVGLVWIPSRSVKMLHKTVHKTVKPLWR